MRVITENVLDLTWMSFALSDTFYQALILLPSSSALHLEVVLSWMTLYLYLSVLLSHISFLLSAEP